MKFSHGQQKLIFILFATTVFLFVVDVVVTKIYQPEKSKAAKFTEVYGSELDKIFNLTLDNFGFENDWKKEIKRSKTKYDSLYKNYKIFLPKDLTIPELLVDLSNNFHQVDARLECLEIKAGGETELNIYSGDYLKLKATLTYGKGERQKGVFGIMLNDFQLSDSEDSLLIGIPEPFCVIISPSSKSADNVNFIKKSNKEYAILLDDNISELKFKLSSGYSENRINGSLKSILGSFANAIFILIDPESDLFNSKDGKFILHELDHRNIKHFSVDQFSFLNKQPGNNIKEKFNYLLRTNADSSYVNIVVEKNDFQELLPEFSVQRKRGVKFLNPSEVQFHKNENLTSTN